MTSLDSRLSQAPLRLLDQVRERIRYLHYSLRTEQACVHWVRAYVRFHGLRHPKEMGRAEVEAFLSWWSALLFLYQQVFGQTIPWMRAIGRPARKSRLPVMLSAADVSTTMIYTHVLKLGAGAVRSPLDALALPAAALH